MSDNRDNHMKGPTPEAFRQLTATPNTTCTPFLLCLYLKLGSATSEIKIKRTWTVNRYIQHHLTLTHAPPSGHVYS